RGMLKALKEKYPQANISAIDYDPGVSEVNQVNRLKLMMTVARNAAGKAAQNAKDANIRQKGPALSHAAHKSLVYLNMFSPAEYR
ncbi:MAG: hypothetical protein FWF99_02960, partial [Desulfovibrionaceae bacterium]|nr:hypothetical protein [Desulfovibrionaceae bacterium]